MRTSTIKDAAGCWPESSAMIGHNLVGQRLGRKGAETRERAVLAILRLLDEPDGPPVTLTRVAREASVGMTSLYLYFPDLGDLLLAALKRVAEQADDTFMDLLSDRWPDATLGQGCLEFLEAHLDFWRRHARLMHMRNSFADACDLRVLTYRQKTATPLLDLLVMQMDGMPGQANSFCSHLAAVMLTGLERLATVVTNPHFRITALELGEEDEATYVKHLIAAEARMIELVIRHQRVGALG